MRPRLMLLLACLVGAPMMAAANPDLRVLAVRERAEAVLQDGAFNFRVLKIRGYSIDVRIGGERRKLKLGQSFAPDAAGCTLIFTKVSPETRIARFATDC